MKHHEMRESTSRSIMDAFWSLYRDKPIEKITVKAICEKAGCNRSTFYEYYTDSYSVLEDIEEELLDYVRRKLTEELPASLANSFPEIRLELFHRGIRGNLPDPVIFIFPERAHVFSQIAVIRGCSSPYIRFDLFIDATCRINSI